MNEKNLKIKDESNLINIEEPVKKKSKVFFLISLIIGTEKVTDIQTVKYISNLPHEVIINIFKYLDFKSICRCSLLCQSLWLASNDSLLYKNICLKNYFHPKHVESYISKIQSPKKLEISYNYCQNDDFSQDSSHFNNQIIRLLSKCGNHLVSLCIECCQSEEVLLNISKCTNLKRLHLIQCQSSFKTLPQLNSLISLELNSCKIEKFPLGELLKNNPQLKVLILRESVKNINAIGEIIGEFNHDLEILEINEKKLLTAKTMKLLGKCSNLRSLELITGSYNNDPRDCLQHIAAGCPKLEKLALVGWKSVSDQNLVSILQSSMQLKFLHLRGLNITIKSCREAALSLPLLKQLDVYKCARIKWTDLNKLKREFPEISISNN